MTKTKKSGKIFLIIPSFNEGKRLAKTINQVQKVVPSLPIIIVDDGSKIPVNLNPQPKLTILRHQLNLGKGAALKTGIKYAFKNKAKAVILIDADGQHSPQEIPQFIKFLNKGYDLVFGSRRLGTDIPLIRFLGNKFASIYVNLLYGIYVSDLLSGYRALNKKAYRLVKWQSSRYGVETEMVARLSKHKKRLKWTEFPIETVYMDKYKGVTIIDALKILFNSIQWKLS